LNITVTKEDLSGVSHECGGAYAVPSLDIVADSNLPLREQRIGVIHEIIENFNLGMCHEKIDELCGYIQEGLDLLEPT